MDKSRSTTPPLPPPESSETLQQQPAELSHSTPPSAQPEIQEGPAAPMEIDGQENEETQDIRIEPVPQSRLPRPAHSRTPEPNRVIHVSHQTNGHAQSNGLANGHSHAAAVSHAPHLAPERLAVPDSPIGNLSAFDWEYLEARFEKALADANDTEQGLMEEFERLIKYFNVWASAASAHDNERAAKRYGKFQCLLSRWPLPLADTLLDYKLEHTLSS